VGKSLLLEEWALRVSCKEGEPVSVKNEVKLIHMPIECYKGTSLSTKNKKNHKKSIGKVIGLFMR
jgi:hypothetical protein